MDNPQSLLNISERWIMEVEKECPHVPIVVVGNKKDLRNDPSTILSQFQFSKFKFFSNFNFFQISITESIQPDPVATEEGLAVKDMIRAFAYVEASAMCNELN
jgi:GTPase SAR1 family protein